jgi:IS605 OrfB family transposase
MKQVLTLVVKLQPSAEQADKLAKTAEQFASACELINREVKPSLTNRNGIQAVIYNQVREQFDLVSNHVIRACARVGSNRLTARQKGRKVKGFKPTSFDCDKDTFRFREKDWTVSLSTVQGRERISLRASNYHKGKLAGQKPTSAQVCQHRDGDWYVHIQLKSEPPNPTETNKVIGVDFGRREIAKTSTDKGWEGKSLQKKRDKFARTRTSLQQKASKGTRSSRRRCREILKRLSGREKRFQKWVNHNVSKSIIQDAKTTGSLIAIEDLTGIRYSTNSQPRNKTERRRSNTWAFYQLRTFLEYKGIKEGVKVVAVPPAFTSKTCHCCLHIGVRTEKRFKCFNPRCGWIGDADLNGAKNLESWGCSVNQPGGSRLLSCDIDGGLLKASSSDEVG